MPHHEVQLAARHDLPVREPTGVQWLSLPGGGLHVNVALSHVFTRDAKCIAVAQMKHDLL